MLKIIDCYLIILKKKMIRVEQNIKMELLAMIHSGESPYLIIDLHEHPFQTILDHPDEDLLDGFRDSFDNGVHPLPH